MAMDRVKRMEVFKRDDFTCRTCGAQAPDVVLQVDHIKPVSAGGADELDNLQTLCRACNVGKGAHPLHEARPVARSAKFNTTISSDVLDRARDAVYALCGPPELMSLARLVEQAVTVEVDRLQEIHNGGEPFPERPTGTKLPTSRRV